MTISFSDKGSGSKRELPFETVESGKSRFATFNLKAVAKLGEWVEAYTPPATLITGSFEDGTSSKYCGLNVLQLVLVLWAINFWKWTCTKQHGGPEYKVGKTLAGSWSRTIDASVLADWVEERCFYCERDRATAPMPLKRTEEAEGSFICCAAAPECRLFVEPEVQRSFGTTSGDTEYDLAMDVD